MATYDYQALDSIIHSRIRLSVLAILSAVERADFTWLRDQTGATDGNLGTHLRKLEDAGYVDVDKRIVDRKPLSRYRLTERGRAAFAEYVSNLERLLRDAPRSPDDDQT
jgi:DNA-binding MarR family transcriptional regulator